MTAAFRQSLRNFRSGRDVLANGLLAAERFQHRAAAHRHPPVEKFLGAIPAGRGLPSTSSRTISDSRAAAKIWDDALKDVRGGKTVGPRGRLQMVERRPPRK
jgi:hypothetical protein